MTIVVIILVVMLASFAAYVRLIFLYDDCMEQLKWEHFVDGKEKQKDTLSRFIDWNSNYTSRRMLFPIAKKSKNEQTNALVKKYNLYVSIFWLSALILFIGVFITLVIVNL